MVFSAVLRMVVPTHSRVVSLAAIALVSCASSRGPQGLAQLEADDVVGAMRAGLDPDAAPEHMRDFSRGVFELLEIRVVLHPQETTEAEALGSHLSALLADDLPLTLRWSAREPVPLVVRVSEPLPVQQIGDHLEDVAQLRPSYLHELADAVGEGAALRSLEAELRGRSPGTPRGASVARPSCTRGRPGGLALCLLERSAGPGDPALGSPREVQQAIQTFLVEHRDRLPRSRALHQLLHEGETVDTPVGAGGRQSVVVAPYDRAEPRGVDGTAVVLSVDCLSCEGHPYPGTVTAVVFVPLSVWSPEDGQIRLWPPPTGASVRFGGAVPPT